MSKSACTNARIKEKVEGEQSNGERGKEETRLLVSFLEF